MLQPNGLEVTIKDPDTGFQYEEFVGRTQHSQDDPNAIKHYIASKDGHRFSIMLDLHPKFDLKEATYLRLSISIDGGQTFNYVRSCHDIPKNRSRTINVVNLSTIIFSTNTSTKWWRGLLAFGIRPIKSDETLSVSPEDIANVARRMGTIYVNITRVTHAFIEQPRPNSGINVIKYGNREVVVERGIYHRFEPEYVDRISRPYSHFQFTRLPGEDGNSTWFKFMYRPDPILFVEGVKEKDPMDIPSCSDSDSPESTPSTPCPRRARLQSRSRVADSQQRRKDRVLKWALKLLIRRNRAKKREARFLMRKRAAEERCK